MFILVLTLHYLIPQFDAIKRKNIMVVVIASGTNL